MAAATVKVLAAYGGDMTAKDDSGKSPLDVTPAYTNGGECKAKTRDAVRNCIQVGGAGAGGEAVRAAAEHARWLQPCGPRWACVAPGKPGPLLPTHPRNSLPQVCQVLKDGVPEALKSTIKGGSLPPRPGASWTYARSCC
jgi:hypothetical protein